MIVTYNNTYTQDAKTLTQLKTEYYDALLAEQEAWRAHSIAVDIYLAGGINGQDLRAMREGAEMFSAAKSAAYSELQAAYRADAEFIAENE